MAIVCRAASLSGRWRGSRRTTAALLPPNAACVKASTCALASDLSAPLWVGAGDGFRGRGGGVADVLAPLGL